MMRTNQIDGIITEDTDLIAHGNNNILYKLNHQGFCLTISYDDIKKTIEFEKFSKDDFLYYCILCVNIFFFN